jgi:hypothetical protein
MIIDGLCVTIKVGGIVDDQIDAAVEPRLDALFHRVKWRPKQKAPGNVDVSGGFACSNNGGEIGTHHIQACSPYNPWIRGLKL